MKKLLLLVVLITIFLSSCVVYPTGYHHPHVYYIRPYGHIYHPYHGHYHMGHRH